MLKQQVARANLDPTDIAILEALQLDGRQSVSSLGKTVGLSQPATSERLKRLEDRGIITGYSAIVDPNALGLGMMAIIRLRTTHEHIKSCLGQFAAMPEILEVLRLTGEDCFHLKVIVPSASDLENIVDTIAKFGPVTTAIVLRREPPKGIGRALIRKTVVTS